MLMPRKLERKRKNYWTVFSFKRRPFSPPSRCTPFCDLFFTLNIMLTLKREAQVGHFARVLCSCVVFFHPC